MSKMALLIIDMLNDFFRQHARLAEQRTRLVASINTLAEAFRHHGQPILCGSGRNSPRICTTHSWRCGSTTCM